MKTATARIFFTLGMVGGCATYDSHENFKNHMSGEVGKYAYERYAFTTHYRNLLVETHNLSNGNIEEKYKAGLWRDGQQCHVFFEIDKESRKIVGWRYEGSKEVCRIPA